MRQVVYISTATASVTPGTADAILAVSRINNPRDGVTGLLYFDGRRFLQVLEGDTLVLDRVLTRIERDDRHRAIVILSDRILASPEFGNWAMAYRAPGIAADVFVDRVAALVADASPSIRATFTGFAEVRRAA